MLQGNRELLDTWASAVTGVEIMPSRPQAPKRKKEIGKEEEKKENKNTTPVGNENTTDDSNSDNEVSISIPTTNRFDPLAVRGSEDSTESDHTEKEESHQESSALCSSAQLFVISGVPDLQLPRQ